MLKTSASSSSSQYVWHDILLFGVAFAMMFWALGERALWGSEGRWAEVTREMLLTGDFFHPTIGGEPYFDKPLLTYWPIALIAFLTGSLNEATARIPSAIAGLAAIWATFRLGIRWSPFVGRLAAWMLLTSYGFIFWSRTAAADTENLAVVVLAVLWYLSRREKPGFITFLVFYLLVFTGSLTKGVVAAAVTGVAILPDILMQRRWKDFFRPAALLAMALGLLVYFVPFFWASYTNPSTYHSSGLALVWQENFLRFFEPIDHKNPFYTYMLSLPVLVFPWTPVFLAAFIAAVKGWKKSDDYTKWLILAVCMIFLFFTASGSRRSYYILPILPFCFLLTAVLLERTGETSGSNILKSGIIIQKYLLFFFITLEMAPALICLASPAVTFLPLPVKYSSLIADYLPLLREIAIPSVVIGLLSIGSIWGAIHLSAGRSKHPEGKDLMALSAVAVVLVGGFFCIQFPMLGQHRSELKFATDIRSRAADIPSERIGLFMASDAKLIFYLGKERPVSLLKDKERLRSFVEDTTPGVIITQEHWVSSFPPEVAGVLSPKAAIAEKTESWDSETQRDKKWAAWFINGRMNVATPSN